MTAVALSQILDLDLVSNADLVRDFLLAHGVNETQAHRLPGTLARAGCSTLREAEERLALGKRIVATEYVPGCRPAGVGVRGEQSLRRVLGLPASRPARRVVLELDDEGLYVDENDVEWIRAEELDQEQAS